MTVNAVLDELSLPVAGDDADLQVLGIAMVLESEFGVRLTDEELTVENLGDPRSIAALLARHGVG